MSEQPPTTSLPVEDESEPVLSLIKQIKDGKLNPKALHDDERRRCVDFLWGEGYSVAEVAQILQVTERTIYRLRREIKDANILRVDPQFGPKMAGELIRDVECSKARLRKIARESSASAMERLMAESAAIKIQMDLFSKLQSMGYLPRIPSSVVAQVVTGSDNIPTYEQMASRLKEIGSVDQELGVQDPLLTQKHGELEAAVQRGLLAAQLEQHYRSHEDPR